MAPKKSKTKKQIRELLKKIKVLFLDADGVFFSGHEIRVTLKNEVIIAKLRHYSDGQGLSFLRELGIKIVFISGEEEPLQSVVIKLNKLPSVENGRWAPVDIFTKQNGKGEKMRRVQEWMKKNKVNAEECAYMGDDVNDFEPMSFISSKGLCISPANATRKIKEIADIITESPGGNGAIREFSEMVIDAREKNELDMNSA